MLLPKGGDSHAYEPSAKDIIALQECDLFVYGGGQSDAWLSEILSDIKAKGVLCISLFDYITVLDEEIVDGMQNNEGDSGEVELDEHVWASPVNAVTIVKTLSDALCKLDEKNSDFYIQNTENYVAKLEKLNSEYKELVDLAQRNTIIVGDRFPFRYLTEEYNLNYYAAFPGCSTQTEPSAATVAFLIDKVKEEGIPVVFYTEYTSGKMADTICGETGAKKLVLHSCHTLSEKDFNNGENYLSLMQQNLAALKEALL
jgi:zinc transport system substrate-binding protein